MGLVKRRDSLNICLTSNGLISLTDYNECLSPDDNDCADNAECINTEGSFTCRCNDELIDISPDPNSDPGRLCRGEDIIRK